VFSEGTAADVESMVLRALEMMGNAAGRRTTDPTLAAA
jgi:hypothetical protein